MTQRLDYASLSPEIFQKFVDVTLALRKASLGHRIQHLVEIRASQLNGCAFCLDLHVKEARKGGDRELRIHHVAVWRESALFDSRERAALAWTELLTKLPEHGVSEEDFAAVRSVLSDVEVAELTFMIMVINAWNRPGVAFTAVPGSLDKLYGLETTLA